MREPITMNQCRRKEFNIGGYINNYILNVMYKKNTYIYFSCLKGGAPLLPSHVYELLWILIKMQACDL